MNIAESLNRIKETWLSKVSENLTTGEGVRSGFKDQLVSFYDQLIFATESGQTDCLEHVLSEWVKARTETELDALELSLTRILGQMLIITLEVSKEELSTDQSSQVVSVVLPIFMKSLEYSAREEARIHIQHMQGELGQARSTLERLEKTKSDFISVAAHELKTPLTLIEGYAAMLEESLPDGDTRQPQTILYLKGVHAGTRRLREIVDDMIDVSIIDNDMLSLTYQPQWLRHLLNAVQRELNPAMRQRNLQFSMRDFPGVDEMFFGDGERLYQALRNIVTNAIKYTPDGGTIRVDGRLLPGFIELIISDTGIGIEPEDHTRIFEKFGRLGNVSLHSSGKTKFKGGGPGLGLPITKGIIEAHEGAIWVESEGYSEEKYPGSTFHIMLPLRKTPPDDKAARLFKELSKQ